MAINYLLLISRQGKLRLAKWYIPLSAKHKAQIVRDVSQLALSRRPRMCNFLEYKGTFLVSVPRSSLIFGKGRKVIYRRYASLFFICEVPEGDNELLALEVIHRYVEVLDRYFGNVCEMDLIFNFQKAYSILDELLIAGELQEPSRSLVLELTKATDVVEETDTLTNAIKEAYFA